MTASSGEEGVARGDLVICPGGTVQGIGCPQDAAGSLTYLGLEADPGPRRAAEPPFRVPLPGALSFCAVGHRASAT